VLLFLLADADGFVVDLIIVLKDGQVAEQGTHEELLRLGGLYYNMWVQQASDNSLESLAES
jgi:ATP-binding cassette subfamily B (MDR/TAP) protein 7